MCRPQTWAFVFLFVLGAPSCFGQVGGYNDKKSLAGYVRDQSTEKGIQSVRIDIQNAQGIVIATTFSGGDGAYSFDDTGSDYYVLVQHEGYAPYRELVRTEGAGYVVRDLYLRRLDSAPGPNVANPISAHQLSVPSSARGAFEKGVRLVTEKSDYRGAVAEFQRAITQYPSYYEAYTAKGMAQYVLGDPTSAEASYRKAIELSLEKYPEAMLRLATMLNDASRFAEAEPPLRKTLALSDSSWRAYFELTRALIGQKRLAEAIDSAAKARDLKPDNPQTYILLYNLHIQANKYDLAVSDADGYLKLVPSGPASDRMRRMRDQVQRAQASERQPVQAPSSTAVANSLKVSLRLEDGLPFSGSANVRLTGFFGSESAGNSPAGATGETVYPNLLPGSYVVEASAPGFVTVKQNIEIKPDQTVETLSLIMKPESPRGPASETGASPLSSRSSIIPRGVDDFVPEVAPDRPCSLFGVLQGAGQRAEQLVNSLQRFTAAERVEHFKVNSAGKPDPAPDVRSFEYIALVNQDSKGGFNLEEYRNGNVVGPQQFPAGIATETLPGHALIFHPSLASDFNFACEGLGQWKGRPAWLVHFEQRQDQPNSFRSYVIGGISYPVLLKGRAWIDADTFQVVRLESDLVKPVGKIHLTRDHVSIEYGTVQFHTGNQQLWLPQTAELYVELQGGRFYRRHTFSDFRIFMTGAAQELRGPKESFCLSNTSDREIVGILSATPASGTGAAPASIRFAIPARNTVCKTVGPGKDLDIPVESLGSATFAHTGPPGSVQGDAFLAKQSTLEIIPDSSVPTPPSR
ncbi:MAG: tetratricopeptide repeat protein [Candidatus Acidiferrales bacterium]|jgi:tetratricopeptide (TPR) repeat protein